MRASITSRAGLSVGWADNYPWFFAFQWIDITGLPGGTYQVRVTVDIQDYYQERIDTDNCVWARLHIPAPGSTDASDRGGGRLTLRRKRDQTGHQLQGR